MSGLTVGYLSIDQLFLQIKLSTGTQKQIRAAKRVIPILQQHHFLLVTLLLANAAAMEALPIFLNALVPSYIAVIISVTAVLFFGQIIPQAVCTGPNQIQIAGSVAMGTKCLMYLLSPISYPISIFLDLCLGKHRKVRFGNQDLKALISLHSSQIISEHKTDFNYGLDQLQSNIIERVIQLNEQRADNTMIELDDVFKVSNNQKICRSFVNALVKSKQRSVPIYIEDNPNLIIGTMQTEALTDILIKQQQEELSLQKIENQFRYFKAPLVIEPSTSLLDAFKMMNNRKAHFCLVTNEAEQLLSAIFDYYDNKVGIKSSDDFEQKSSISKSKPSDFEDIYSNNSFEISINPHIERERSMSQSLHLNNLLGENLNLVSVLGIVTFDSIIEKLLAPQVSHYCFTQLLEKNKITTYKSTSKFNLLNDQKKYYRPIDSQRIKYRLPRVQQTNCQHHLYLEIKMSCKNNLYQCSIFVTQEQANQQIGKKEQQTKIEFKIEIIRLRRGDFKQILSYNRKEGYNDDLNETAFAIQSAPITTIQK